MAHAKAPLSVSVASLIFLFVGLSAVAVLVARPPSLHNGQDSKGRLGTPHPTGKAVVRKGLQVMAQRLPEGELSTEISDLLQRPAAAGSSKVQEPPYVTRYNQHQYILSPLLRRKGLVYMGGGQRMRRFVTKLTKGEAVTVATIGGSVTAGAGSTSPEVSWPGRFFKFLSTTFPNPNHEMMNRAVGAINSGVASLCVKKMIPQNADMVIVEFAFNEDHDAAFDTVARKMFETFLRKLLRLPKKPVVIMLHHYAWWQCNMPSAGVKGGIFWGGAEMHLSQFAQYYDLPSVSIRAAAYHQMRQNVGNFGVSNVLYTWKDEDGSIPAGNCTNTSTCYYHDVVHPMDFGHGAMADLVIELLWQSLRQLVTLDSSAEGLVGAAGEREEQWMEEADIPPPMIPKNVDVDASTCLLQEDFKDVVVQASNFTWAAQKPRAPTFNRQKWSWRGTRPGAWAELLVDTRTEVGATPGSSNVTAVLGFMRSYEKMGSAKVECVAGCTCAETSFDATWESRTTLMQMHPFEVSQAEQCRIRVTILPETKSEGHKISLVFIMVSQFPILLHYFDEMPTWITDNALP